VDLPLVIDLAAGWIGSANNPPLSADPPIGRYQWTNGRIRRMSELLDGREGISIDDIAALQRDVVSPSARDLAHALAKSQPDHPLAAALAAWNGSYDAANRTALLLEQIKFQLLTTLYADRYGSDAARSLRGAAFVDGWLLEDVLSAEEDVRAALGPAFDAVQRWASANPETVWGDQHRLRIAHPFAYLPIIGKRYAFQEFPAEGATSTLAKAARSVSDRKGFVSYGANARFLADMAEPDATWVTLLGGQDGRLNSSSTLDQVSRWRQGDAIRLPLTAAGISTAYPHRTVIRPGG
jgi:penicillin amidase